MKPDTTPAVALAQRGDGAEAEVRALYASHAVSLIRLAYVMTGDRPTAEDVVQDAFAGLFRHWDRLTDPGSALRYVRSSVLNGSRSVLRRRPLGRRLATLTPPLTVASAEAAVLGLEERHQVMRAVRALPDRQRQAVVMRFYLDLPDDEIAQIMGISQGTVRSAAHRALKALGKILGETS